MFIYLFIKKKATRKLLRHDVASAPTKVVRDTRVAPAGPGSAAWAYRPTTPAGTYA
jgi:hypothetical protein